MLMLLIMPDALEHCGTLSPAMLQSNGERISSGRRRAICLNLAKCFLVTCWAETMAREVCFALERRGRMIGDSVVTVGSEAGFGILIP